MCFLVFFIHMCLLFYNIFCYFTFSPFNSIISKLIVIDFLLLALAHALVNPSYYNITLHKILKLQIIQQQKKTITKMHKPNIKTPNLNPSNKKHIFCFSFFFNIFPTFNLFLYIFLIRLISFLQMSLQFLIFHIIIIIIITRRNVISIICNMFYTNMFKRISNSK